MNELELRYGDCAVKWLSGGTLSAAMRNLEKFHYAGTPLGTIRLTGQYGCPVGEIVKNSETSLWYFTPVGQDSYAERVSAATLMGDIKAYFTSEAAS